MLKRLPSQHNKQLVLSAHKLYVSPFVSLCFSQVFWVCLEFMMKELLNVIQKCTKSRKCRFSYSPFFSILKNNAAAT